jgi:molybdopterin biosynthesis enzyme
MLYIVQIIFVDGVGGIRLPQVTLIYIWTGAPPPESKTEIAPMESIHINLCKAVTTKYCARGETSKCFKSILIYKNIEFFYKRNINNNFSL